MKKISNDLIQNFKEFLMNEEKAVATIEKYIHDVLAFMKWMAGAEVTKVAVLKYKQELTEKYAPASVNSMLSSLNAFFSYNEWYDCKVKTLKIQKQIFASKDKELTKTEYEKLLIAAKQKNNQRLYFLMQTRCSTGRRVSELRFITVESVIKGQAYINCKGKMRVKKILILKYVYSKIKSIFVHN